MHGPMDVKNSAFIMGIAKLLMTTVVVVVVIIIIIIIIIVSDVT